MLTKRQRQIHEFILGRIRSEGRSPTYAEIANRLGMSRSNAYRLVSRIIGRGLLRRTPGRWNGLEPARRRYFVADYGDDTTWPTFREIGA